MDTQHREAVLYCLIMRLSETVIASPVHPFRLGRKGIKYRWAATEHFPNFLRFDE